MSVSDPLPVGTRVMNQRGTIGEVIAVDSSTAPNLVRFGGTSAWYRTSDLDVVEVDLIPDDDPECVESGHEHWRNDPTTMRCLETGKSWTVDEIGFKDHTDRVQEDM